MKSLLPLAIEVAKNLPHEDYKVSAIITDRKNKILSIGSNSYCRTHPLQQKYAKMVGQDERIFLHAEISAIVNLRYGTKPYSIYIARVNKKGESLFSKPCPICSLALKDIGIQKIFYTY